MRGAAHVGCPRKGGVSSGIAVRHGPLASSVSISRSLTPGHVRLGDTFWTEQYRSCDASYMTAADPLLVARRHVDLLRVRSAVCRHGR
jgi:hypothetical protein